nr:MAG TPA: hypothetical protein [Caudoviricetes sp.]
MLRRPHCAPKFLSECVCAGQAWLFIVSPHLHLRGKCRTLAFERRFAPPPLCVRW